jgi:hypothetical protein
MPMGLTKKGSFEEAIMLSATQCTPKPKKVDKSKKKK